MKGSGSHLYAKIPPSTNELEGLSGLASRRVVDSDEYHAVSDPIIASIHYEAFSKHLASYADKGCALSPHLHLILPIYPHSRVFLSKRKQSHDRSSRSLLSSSSRNSVQTSTMS